MVVQMPKHIASGLKYLAAVKLKEAGESHQAIADELGIDRSTVSHYLNGRNLSWNSIDVAKTITELSPRDFLIMTNAVFDEPEQSRKIVNICREKNYEATIEDSCIGCGLCVNVCSMKAIKLESLKAHTNSADSIKILEI
ncbi:4Fe-4S binding protein [uncultured Methanobrevibacter sp.]|uniref:4Fe-4S binding protein n=1 Tax=uncultured Methanobrevibacter sp. TaxID=253161 RepID=UPI00345D299B